MRTLIYQSSIIAFFKERVIMDDLLQQGIAAYKAGKRDEARKFFMAAVKQSLEDERAWGWMYQVSNDDKERIYCLKQILRINPKNEKANQLLNQLLTLSFIAPMSPSNDNQSQQAVENLRSQKEKMFREIQELEKRKHDFDQQLSELAKQIELKKNEIIVLDDEVLFQSFGFYKPHYDLQNSEIYKAELAQCRSRQERLVKLDMAAAFPKGVLLGNSLTEGEKMIKDNVKLILRSFNNECDASIVNVKFSNVASIEKRIRKAFDMLNNLGKRLNIAIVPEYLALKIQELYLCYEYQVKKQEEKEEQKLIREQMREDARVLKEIEAMKLKIEKEEKHFNKALENINAKLEQVQTESEKGLLEKERQNIIQNMSAIEKDKLDVQNREQNTRAGYVYIISNLGAFGENIYKIGVTRRLDPEERVDELGDSSVPFGFDIHALIFSDDAPTLENALHKAFEHKRLNMINRRREFFNVSLDDIELVVKKNFNKPVEFVKLADAAEYRESLMLKKTVIAQ
jgi:septal ring factor EnvC (AmiA/AmiB activator)